MTGAKSAELKSAILTALDDLSAAVDAFAERFERLDDILLRVGGRLQTIEEQLTDLDARIETRVDRDDLRDIARTLEDVASTIETLEDRFTGIDAAMPDMSEIVDDMRRRERQEWLFDARAAMGKVAFVRVKG